MYPMLLNHSNNNNVCPFYAVKPEILPAYVRMSIADTAELFPEIWTWTRNDNLGLNNFDAYITDAVVEFHPMLAFGTAGARGTRKLLHDTVAYWEVRIYHAFGTSMMFGIGQENAKMIEPMNFEDLLGMDKLSLGINHKGNLFYDGKKLPFMQKFFEGSVTRVGMLFNGPNRSLEYYINSVYAGVVNEIDTSVPWYPMVSSTAQKSFFRAEACFSNAHKRGSVPKSLLHTAMDVVDKKLVNSTFKIPSIIKEKVAARRSEYNEVTQVTLTTCSNKRCMCHARYAARLSDSFYY